MSPNALCQWPGSVAADHLLVARDEAEWCYALREAFAARGNYTVIIDRRYAERQRDVQSVLAERRGARRSRSAITTDPRRSP
jgi:hypothetical protein